MKPSTLQSSSARPTPAPGSYTVLLPIIGAVFVAYLVIGLALPILPLHVHERLGFGPFVVGVVAGSQFAAALISRMSAGRYTDTRGPKRAIVIGLLTASGAGLFYLLSLRFVSDPASSVWVLLVGRALLGVADSLILTGAQGWGLALLGTNNTGKAMSCFGTALNAAFAIGAPVGTLAYSKFGFAAVALATILIPAAALVLVAPLRSATPRARAPAGFRQVVAAVWIPGAALALSSVGLSAITTFIGLLFSARGWGSAWLAFSAVSIAFIAGRVLFGHLPDKLGGVRVALVCILVEALGQALIWIAPSSELALLGVTVTGLGYSLVYPGLGVEAVRAAPLQSHALAMGAYTAFLDLSLGFSGPVLGVVASGSNIADIYLVSTFTLLCSAALAMQLLLATSRRSASSFFRDAGSPLHKKMNTRPELGHTSEDAVVRRLVVVLLECGKPSLDVQRQRLDRADVAVVRSGEGVDGRHSSLRLLLGPRPSQPRWRSLARGAIGPQPSCPRRQRRAATSLPAFLSPTRNAATSRQQKKAGAAVAGRRSRPWPALGPD